MEKTDLAKANKNYYKAKAKPELIALAKAQYLSIKGKGDPNGHDFVSRVQALYTTAYTMKFMFKAKGQDFVVPKLEGLWWFDIEKYSGVTFAAAPKQVPRAEWEYRLLIQMPPFVTSGLLPEAMEQVVTSKQLPLAASVEWYQMAGRKYVQMLHVGPFDKEPETLGKIEKFIIDNGLRKDRLHHEVYLSDFRLTPPDKLKTILREPIK